MQPGDESQPVAVRVTWRRSDAIAGIEPEGWITCFFLPRSQTNGAWQIDMMDTQKYGKMRRYDVQQLYKLRWLNQNYIPKLEEGETPSPPGQILWLYGLQQTINALTLGCLYALLAVGFTIIYDVTRAVNLAFGDLYMVGAFVTYISYVVVAANGGSFDWAVGAWCCCWRSAPARPQAGVTDRVAFRHMRRGATTVPLVASIGIALIFRDVVRLAQGPKAKWMPPTARHHLAVPRRAMATTSICAKGIWRSGWRRRRSPLASGGSGGIPSSGAAIAPRRRTGAWPRCSASTSTRRSGSAS